MQYPEQNDSENLPDALVLI